MKTNIETITVTDAGNLLGKSKEKMKVFVEENNLTKIANNGYRYLLSKDEVLKYRLV